MRCLTPELKYWCHVNIIDLDCHLKVINSCPDYPPISGRTFSFPGACQYLLPTLRFSKIDLLLEFRNHNYGSVMANGVRKVLLMSFESSSYSGWCFSISTRGIATRLKAELPANIELCDLFCWRNTKRVKSNCITEKKKNRNGVHYR